MSLLNTWCADDIASLEGMCHDLVTFIKAVQKIQEPVKSSMSVVHSGARAFPGATFFRRIKATM